MSFSHHRGNVIIFLIIAMSLIATLGGGMFYMNTISTQGELGANNLNRAYRLALAGKDYALTKNLGDTAGRVFTLANGDKSSLVISGDTVKSTGIVNEGTPLETRRKITVTKSGFSSQADISFARDIAEFKPEIGKERESTPGFVSVDTTTSQITLGQSMLSQFGAVWYAGNASQGNCQSGKCNFGGGFTAFFVFRLQKSSSYTLGDGFTFAIFNGEDNDLYSMGGHAGMGELMAYAGSSYFSSGVYLDNKNGEGIRPPKIAVEFDPYSNTGSASVCPPASNNRNDATGDHMAYVFWGDNSSECSGYGTSAGQKSYDDNRHGAGSGGVNEPRNSLSTDTYSYFSGGSWGSSWLERTVAYAFRIEIRRSAGTGNYNYEVKSWIKECPDFACTAYTEGPFGNTKVAYTADNPTIRRTVADGNQIVLDSTYHSKFDKFIFGWTAATGGATQNITIKNFKLYFIK